MASTIEQTTSGKKAVLALRGPIDEGSDYTAAQWQGVEEVTFDFSGVTLINSTGLQRWIKFLEGIPAGVRIAFARCPVRVVNQINMFPGFLAGRSVQIESFYASYYCEACDKSSDVLLETGKDFKVKGAAVGAPARACPDCKTEMEFDGIEKKFFLFLRTAA
jgi:hypothetical protein